MSNRALNWCDLQVKLNGRWITYGTANTREIAESMAETITLDQGLSARVLDGETQKELARYVV